MHSLSMAKRAQNNHQQHAEHCKEGLKDTVAGNYRLNLTRSITTTRSFREFVLNFLILRLPQQHLALNDPLSMLSNNIKLKRKKKRTFERLYKSYLKTT